MRKYIHIYKSELMSTLQYMLNILFRLINFILLIFIFMNLWTYIYDNPNELINGYSKNQMIWYVIITEIIWTSTEGRKCCKRIVNDVRSGNIAYVIIDHFIGLESYWSIPPDETDARNGKWIKGPGEDFIDQIHKYKNNKDISY